MRDFNIVRKPEEKHGAIYNESMNEKFNKICYKARIDDIKSSGSLFT